MARSVATIQAQITASYVEYAAANGVVVDPTNWSTTNVQRMLIYAVAFAIQVMEQFFDTHKIETNESLADKKPHSLRWYANMAKAYQHGFSLLLEDDQYDNEGFTAEQIAEAKIVSYAAVVKRTNQYGRSSLRIKVAKTNDTDLVPLDNEELAGLNEYMGRVSDAGVDFSVESGPADRLKIKARFFYDPLVITAAGSRIDGTNNDPAGSAIREYLTEMPFNGTLVLPYLVNKVEGVEGCVTFVLDECSASYGSVPPVTIDVMYQPDSGYLRIYENADLDIAFIAQSPIV